MAILIKNLEKYHPERTNSDRMPNTFWVLKRMNALSHLEMTTQVKAFHNTDIFKSTEKICAKIATRLLKFIEGNHVEWA